MLEVNNTGSLGSHAFGQTVRASHPHFIDAQIPNALAGGTSWTQEATQFQWRYVCFLDLSLQPHYPRRTTDQ